VDDLVQEVFPAALGRLSGLRDDGAFGGWLVTIARNRAYDYYRRAPA
jgi:DNA-directed RNA polymerase specialized sigma24 family protein